MSKELKTVCLKLEDKSGVFGNFVDIENADQVNIEGIPTTELVRRKDVKKLLLEEIGHHELIADSFWNLFENKEPKSEYRETAEKHSEISAVLKEVLSKTGVDLDKTLDSGRGEEQ